MHVALIDFRNGLVFLSDARQPEVDFLDSSAVILIKSSL